LRLCGEKEVNPKENSMKTHNLSKLLIVFLAVIFVMSGMSISLAAEYKVIQKVTLGGEGGWDYLTVDNAAHRLYLSRGTHVMVVNTDTYEAVADIPNTPGVHGIALVPGLGRGFTSNGRENTVTIFDLKTLKVLGQAKTGTNPDAIIYDSASKRVFTFNGRSNDATAIDAATGEVAGTIPLGGKPEFAVADGKGKIYVNIEDKSEVIAFDSQKLAVLNHWPLAPCEEPSGLAFDIAHRRLFSGCHNKMMSVMNADTGKVITTIPIGAGVDANRFDPETQLVFSSNGSDGNLTVAHEDSPDQYTVVQTVETARGARTMELDPKSHVVYLVTAQYGPAPAATPENPRPRPTMVPGSFQLIVLGR
jgi:YVTN family beta-propeller protein